VSDFTVAVHIASTTSSARNARSTIDVAICDADPLSDLAEGRGATRSARGTAIIARIQPAQEPVGSCKVRCRYGLDEAVPTPGAEKTCDSGDVGELLQLVMIEATSNVPVPIVGVAAAPPRRLEELDISFEFTPEPALTS
jgi:hypothetical protein